MKLSDLISGANQDSIKLAMALLDEVYGDLNKITTISTLIRKTPLERWARATSKHWYVPNYVTAYWFLNRGFNVTMRGKPGYYEFHTNCDPRDLTHAIEQLEGRVLDPIYCGLIGTAFHSTYTITVPQIP